MAKVKLSFKENAGIDLDAQIATVELERIHEKYGLLRSEDIVNESKNNSAPLHNYFEWDDEIAGHKYRVIQARKLISVVIVKKKIHGEYKNVRWYHPVKIEKASGYATINEILKSGDLVIQTLEKAKKEYLNMRWKYSDLKGLALINNAIDETFGNNDL